jgi:hypothetical protein
MRGRLGIEPLRSAQENRAARTRRTRRHRTQLASRDTREVDAASPPATLRRHEMHHRIGIARGTGVLGQDDTDALATPTPLDGDGLVASSTQASYSLIARKTDDGWR